jgi:Na+/phosphate symporter
MIANALLIAVAFLLAYAFWLMDQLKFMAPYKSVLFHEYGNVMLVSAGVLFVNVFGAALLFQRKFFLKDTGRKLSHLDQQFHVGGMELPIAPRSTEDEAYGER